MDDDYCSGIIINPELHLRHFTMNKQVFSTAGNMPQDDLICDTTAEGSTDDSNSFDVSIILPVYNASRWLDECMQGVANQTFSGTLELSVYNDGSTDDSLTILERWQSCLLETNITMVLSSGVKGHPRGVGYAKNHSVYQSHGKFLCFQDADDVMHKDRIMLQHAAAQNRETAIIGAGFCREPADSTKRYTEWANQITQVQLMSQAYTSHGPTIIMPTWFCHRDIFSQIGGFDISGRGTPEDLIFFYKHLRQGGGLYRVDECLLTYRYHLDAATFSVHEDTIWKLRVSELQDCVLDKWPSFTIWNAGKQGRHLYRSLSSTMREKVTGFCDVDQKKISKGVYIHEESSQRPKPRVPIVHFSDAQPPFIICVKQDLTGGQFEENLASLHLNEGKDYYFFS